MLLPDTRLTIVDSPIGEALLVVCVLEAACVTRTFPAISGARIDLRALPGRLRLGDFAR
jgi:hypothetical protein